MQRFDLRHLHGEFYDRMLQIMDADVSRDEVAIFMFEVGDFSPVQKSADMLKERGYELMNSLKYNEVDWVVVVRKSA